MGSLQYALFVYSPLQHKTYECVSCLFFFIVCSISTEFVYPFTCWTFECLPICSKAAEHIGILVFLWTYVFILGKYLGVESLGSVGKYIFNCIRNSQPFNFIYFWLHWVFVGVHEFSPAAESRGYSLVMAHRLLVAVASLMECGLWSLGLVASHHVESSRTRDQICVPCVGRWIPNHCTTREAQTNS